MSGGILALDLATHLGWACGRLPARPLTPIEAAAVRQPKPASGVYRVAEPGCPIGRFLFRYQQWLAGMLQEFAPAGLIFEAPILPRVTHPATARKLMSLAGLTQMLAWRANIAWVREAQPSSVKKYISGYGGPGKDRVMQAIRARGWAFADDNEADSLALWLYGGDLFLRERVAA